MSLTAPSTTTTDLTKASTDGSVSATSRPESNRLDALIETEAAAFMARQPRSRELIERARHHLAGGATSNWQIASPHAVWLSHGAGSKIYDVDGTEYVDLHGGYGVSLAGHAHPAVVAAIRERAGLGTHFAQPTIDAIDVAENLAERFGLPQWRYANSGTEATMDAVHLMRAVTGRDLIIKLEGGYHGHHDSVEVSVLPEPEDVGPAEAPAATASNSGIPEAIRDLTLVVAFNDLDMVRRVLEAHPGQVAGMIPPPMTATPPAGAPLAGGMPAGRVAGTVRLAARRRTAERGEIGRLAEELAQREQYATGDSDRFPGRATAARR